MVCVAVSQEQSARVGGARRVKDERQVGFVAVRHGPRQLILRTARVLFTSSLLVSIHAGEV